MTTGVGASKFWGVQRILAQIFPNLHKTLSCNFCQPFFGVTSKKWSSIVFLQTLGGIFRSQQDWVPFFAQTWRDFVQICGDFTRFFREFARIFNKSKLLGVRALPFCQAPPASYTTVNDDYNILLNSFSFIIDEHQNIQIVMKSNNVLQLQTTMSFKTNHIRSELCNKRFNASRVSLLFAIHNSIDT